MHEFGHFIIAKLSGVRVEVFSIGFGRRIFGVKRGETDYRLSLVPLGGYVKMAGDNPEEKLQGQQWEFLSQPAGKRALIIAAGALFNFFTAFILFALVFFIGMPKLTSMVGDVVEDYPAAEAGIKVGDRIVAVNGEDVRFWDELSAIIHEETTGKAVRLEIEREERAFTVEVIPRVEQTKTLLGDSISLGLIGIAPAQDTETVNYGVFESIFRGAERVFMLTRMTLLSLYRMLVGRISARESLAGPVLIYQITGEAARLGITYLLQIMAALSVSLGVINLMPVPVLDGGHLLFILIEKIRGRPLSLRAQEIASRIGLSLLIALMLFVFYNDLTRVGVFNKFFNPSETEVPVSGGNTE